jgi:hypothetical protein
MIQYHYILFFKLNFNNANSSATTIQMKKAYNHLLLLLVEECNVRHPQKYGNEAI